MKQYAGIGIMSGTSHDGLDIAYCVFYEQGDGWQYEIKLANTLPYPDELRSRLISLHLQDNDIIEMMDRELGIYIGKAVKRFIGKNNIEAGFIGSHGHTILHQPDKGITLQIGDGKSIASCTGLRVINNFRSEDVAMGGQGAPLVPLGDRLLFSDYDFCLNLGGISNISYEEDGSRLAFDICPVNMVLNLLAEKLGKEYDDKGNIAAGGSLIKPLLEKLEALSFYRISGPKSLGKEWVEENVIPLINEYAYHPVQDLLATFTEHVALRISVIVNRGTNKQLLISGGGAYNDYLIDRIRKHTECNVVLPDPHVIEYKEAMIFAFLGLLKLLGRNNVLGSVTGSGADHCAGNIIEAD